MLPGPLGGPCVLPSLPPPELPAAPLPDGPAAMPARASAARMRRRVSKRFTTEYKRSSRRRRKICGRNRVQRSCLIQCMLFVHFMLARNKTSAACGILIAYMPHAHAAHTAQAVVLMICPYLPQPSLNALKIMFLCPKQMMMPN